jgi:hypothetical protein
MTAVENRYAPATSANDLRHAMHTDPAEPAARANSGWRISEAMSSLPIR